MPHTVAETLQKRTCTLQNCEQSWTSISPFFTHFTHTQAPWHVTHSDRTAFSISDGKTTFASEEEASACELSRAAWVISSSSSSTTSSICSMQSLQQDMHCCEKHRLQWLESAATADVTTVKQCRLQVYGLGSWLGLRSFNMETPVRFVSVQSSTWVSGCLPFSL